MMGRNLNIREIEEQLTVPGYVLHYAETVDSTNDWAKREAVQDLAEGQVYLADHQSAGKGRRGRAWNSPEGTSVSMSLLLRPQIPAERVSMITLVMGMAAAEGIRQASGLDVGIKWPNDVVIDGKKLCGILTETDGRVSYCVPGIGINVNVSEFPEELADKATSLYLQTGREISREKVTAAVLNAFMVFYRSFCERADLSALKERYEELLVNRNARVRIMDEKDPFTGTALGIDEMGDLLVLRDGTDTIEKVFAGEVSVRGIYGYVI